MEADYGHLFLSNYNGANLADSCRIATAVDAADAGSEGLIVGEEFAQSVHSENSGDDTDQLKAGDPLEGVDTSPAKEEGGSCVAKTEDNIQDGSRNIIDAYVCDGHDGLAGLQLVSAGTPFNSQSAESSTALRRLPFRDQCAMPRDGDSPTTSTDSCGRAEAKARKFAADRHGPPRSTCRVARRADSLPLPGAPRDTFATVATYGAAPAMARSLDLLAISQCGFVEQGFREATGTSLAESDTTEQVEQPQQGKQPMHTWLSRDGLVQSDLRRYFPPFDFQLRGEGFQCTDGACISCDDRDAVEHIQVVSLEAIAKELAPAQYSHGGAIIPGESGNVCQSDSPSLRDRFPTFDEEARRPAAHHVPLHMSAPTESSTGMEGAAGELRSSRRHIRPWNERQLADSIPALPCGDDDDDVFFSGHFSTAASTAAFPTPERKPPAVLPTERTQADEFGVVDDIDEEPARRIGVGFVGFVAGPSSSLNIIDEVPIMLPLTQEWRASQRKEKEIDGSKKQLGLQGMMTVDGVISGAGPSKTAGSARPATSM